MSVFRYKLFPQGPPALPPRGWAAEQGRPPRPAPLGERGLSSRQAASLPLQTSRRPEVPVALGSRLASAVPTLWGGEQVLSTFGSGFGHVMKWPHGGAAASWPPPPPPCPWARARSEVSRPGRGQAPRSAPSHAAGARRHGLSWLPRGPRRRRQWTGCGNTPPWRSACQGPVATLFFFFLP